MLVHNHRCVLLLQYLLWLLRQYIPRGTGASQIAGVHLHALTEELLPWCAVSHHVKLSATSWRTMCGCDCRCHFVISGFMPAIMWVQGFQIGCPHTMTTTSAPHHESHEQHSSPLWGKSNLVQPGNTGSLLCSLVTLTGPWRPEQH